MNTLVSVKYAAEYLGVSASTFKRTCEKHDIPLMRTAGGHRRIDRAELDRAFGLLWKGAKRTHGSLPISAAELTDGMIAQLVKGNVDEVLSTICHQIDRWEELATILENTLVSALWKVGELWRSGEMDVYQERICSNTVDTVLNMLLQKIPANDSRAPLAIGGTFESNFDTIGSKMISVILRSIGVSTFNLGCNLPPKSIAKAARDFNASIVWICHTHVLNLESILASHLELREALPSSVRVLTGGGGLSPAMRRSLIDCVYFESFALMSEAVKQTLQEPKIAKKDSLD